MIESLHIKTVRRYFLSLCILEILYLLFYWNTVRINFFQVFFYDFTNWILYSLNTHTQKKRNSYLAAFIFLITLWNICARD